MHNVTGLCRRPTLNVHVYGARPFLPSQPVSDVSRRNDSCVNAEFIIANRAATVATLIKNMSFNLLERL